MTAPLRFMNRKRLKNKLSSTCRVDACGAGVLHPVYRVLYSNCDNFLCVLAAVCSYKQVFVVLPYVLSTTSLFSVLHADGITRITKARVRTGVARPAKCTEP